MDASGNSWQTVCSTLPKQLFRFHVYTRAHLHPVLVQKPLNMEWDVLNGMSHSVRFQQIDP